MGSEDKRAVKLTDLPDDAKLKIAAAGDVKGGAPSASEKGVLFFDEADALFGRDGGKKQTP